MIEAVRTTGKTATSAQDVVVCHCHEIHESEIRSVIEQDCENSVEGVGRRTCAGTGCGACRCKIQRLLNGQPINCGPCAFCPGCRSIMKLCTCPLEDTEAAVA